MSRVVFRSMVVCLNEEGLAHPQINGRTTNNKRGEGTESSASTT
jgi:hypothetical protein